MTPLSQILEQIIRPIHLAIGPLGLPPHAPLTDLLSHQNISVEYLSGPPTLPWSWLTPAPAFIGVRGGQERTVWIWGSPEGQEEKAFHDILLMVGRDRTYLTPDGRDRIRRFNMPVAMAVLTTPD